MPIPPRIHTLLAVLAGGLGLGCEPNDPALAPSAAPPALAISDGAHGGNPHFYFLPPLVHTPAATGTFDPAVSPTVTICALTAGACGVTIATYTTSSGPGGEIVSLDAADELYRLNWKTGDFALSDAVNYRIQVFAGSVSLGFADVDVARHASEFRDLTSGDVIGLVDGRTLPIKFRIETGVVGSILITPATADLEVGDTQQFAAVVLDQHGSPLPDAVVWSSTASGVAGVSFTGVATASSAGAATIRATVQGLTGGAALEVFPASQIAWLKGTESQVWIMSGLGKHQTFLADQAFGNPAPGWSPDGSRLVFARLANPAPNLWIMNADGTAQTPLTGGEHGDFLPRWSPTGALIAFFRGDDALMTVTPTGAALTAALSTQAAPWFDWSPDGQHLAATVVDGTEGDIVVMNPDGTGAVNLTTDATGRDFEVRWSPDGSRLVFTRTPVPAFTPVEIYTMHPDGTGKTRLTHLGVTSQPEWSPDGSRILFSNNGDLFVMDADGGNLLRLTNTPGLQEDDAVWSPDGGRIAFRRHDVESIFAEIWAMKADGTKVWQLTQSPTDDDEGPAWRP